MPALYGPSRHTALNVGYDPVEAVLEFVLVRGDEEDEYAEEGEHDEMNGSIDRDCPQDDLVAQGPAARRHRNLLKRRKMGSGRILWRWEGQPAVAAKASMPAHPVAFAYDDRVLRADLGDIGADQLVTPEAADEQLVVKPGPKPPRPLDSRRQVRSTRAGHAGTISVNTPAC